MSMGSSPMFPTVNYSNTAAYVINHIKIGTKNKRLFINLSFSRRIFALIQFFKKLKYINFFYLYKTTGVKFLRIKVFPFFYKNLSVLHEVKLMSKPSKNFYISLKALRLAAKRSDNVIFLISTSGGIMPHGEALKKKLSGFLFAYFFI